MAQPQRDGQATILEEENVTRLTQTATRLRQRASLQIAVIAALGLQATACPPGLLTGGPGSELDDPASNPAASTGLLTDCGDGELDGTEQCDTADLGGNICTSQGFDGGTLVCTDQCTFDTSGCYACGDGRIDGNEACDGAQLGGETCQSQGFDSGTIACSSRCQLDLAGCQIASCGNGQLDPAEQCEGADLGGKTCASLGFDGGTLACKANCSIETSGCYACGDTVKNGIEQCDGSDLGGMTCASLGFDGGALGCKADCTFHTLGCDSCGDGEASGDEQCDGSDLDGRTCLSLGFAGGGLLSCHADCTLDTSGCVQGVAADGSVGGADAMLQPDLGATGDIDLATGTLPEGNTGIASKYKGDVNIESDPAVIFADNFEGYSSASALSSRWDSIYQSSNISIVTTAANVFRGSQAVELRVPQTGSEVSNALAKELNPERDVLFVRFHSKFDTSFDAFDSTHHGGSISAHYYINGQATPGVPADGTNKFLVNYECFRDQSSTPSPGDLNIYIYHPEQRSQWGDHFFPTGMILPNSSQPHNFGPTFVPRPNVVPKLGQWYSFEFMVKANTPGQRDGRVALWLDGKLIADFPNLRLRDIESLKIDHFEIDFHIGSNTAGATKKWYDNVVAATSYIGPLVD